MFKKTHTNLDSRFWCSGKGWRKLPPFLECRRIHSYPKGAVRDATATPATATNGSKWRVVTLYAVAERYLYPIRRRGAP